MRRFHLSIICLLIGICLYAQSDDNVKSPYPNKVTIGAMTVERVGSKFSIGYKILLGKNVRWCETKLLVSTDGGKTFSFTPTPEYVSGDIGQLNSSGIKTIRYDVSVDKENLAGKQVVFKVDVVSKDVLKSEILASAQVSVLQYLSYGFMFGMVKKYGWYVKALSDFSFPSVSYNCSSDGEIEGGGYVWADGTYKKSRLVVTAGGMLRASRFCYPYFGVGYGSRGFYWKDISDEWVRVSDKSCAGVALDAGVALKFGMIAFTVGVNNIAFKYKYTEAEVGIGIMF